MNRDIDVRTRAPGDSRADAGPARNRRHDRPDRRRRGMSPKRYREPILSSCRRGTSHVAQSDWPSSTRGYERFLTERLGCRRLGGTRARPRARHRALHGHRRLDRTRRRARRSCMAGLLASPRLVRRQLSASGDRDGHGRRRLLRLLRRPSACDPLRLCHSRPWRAGAAIASAYTPASASSRREDRRHRRAHGSPRCGSLRLPGEVLFPHRQRPCRRIRTHFEDRGIARAQGHPRRLAAVSGRPRGRLVDGAHSERLISGLGPSQAGPVSCDETEHRPGRRAS